MKNNKMNAILSAILFLIGIVLYSINIPTKLDILNPIAFVFCVVTFVMIIVYVMKW